MKCQRPGTAWQKACRRPSGSTKGPVGRGEDDARGAQRQRDDPALHRAHADGAGSLIAPAGDHGHAHAQPRGLGGFPGQVPGDGRALVRGRQVRGGDIQRRQHFRRPGARPQVEQDGAGPVGAVHGVGVGQLEAHIVLGQEDVAGARPDLRLVLLHPEDLGRREAGERVVAGNGDEARLAQAGAHLVALGARALVVPEDGRAQDLAGLVQEDQPVHLPGEADGGDRLGVDPRLGEDAADALHGAVPPEVGVLFGPEGFGGLVVVLACGDGDDVALFVDEQGLGGGGR